MLIAPPTIPRIPGSVGSAPPAPARRHADDIPDAPETLGQLLLPAIKGFTRVLPKMLPRLAVFLLIVIAINVILMPLQLWRMSPAIASFLEVVIFLTAAYSSILPKTFFWILIFMGARHILRQARFAGIPAVLNQFTRGCTATVELLTSGLQKSLPVLIAGAGLGMMATIYLSSNTPGRSAPTILAMIGIIYLQGAGSSLLVSAVHLGARDVRRFFKKGAQLEKRGVQRFLAAALVGAPPAFLLMLISSTVGYVIGTLVILVGVALPFVRSAPGES